MEPCESTIELTINSSFKFTELVASVTDNITQIVGFGQEDAHWISLSVRESVINAIKHGNKLDYAKQVDVTFVIGEENIAIYVRDYGEGFDPDKIPNPLDPTNLLNPSGRGIFYMRTFMDEVIFSSHPQGGTVVKMLKRRVNTENSES
jgi:serine/threonine-protein kinase RsbW